MLKEEQIKTIAETLLPSFIPKSPEETELSFHFTVPPNQSFKVWYTKDKKSIWQFIRYEKVEA